MLIHILARAAEGAGLWLLALIIARELGAEALAAFGVVTALVAPFMLCMRLGVRSVIPVQQTLNSINVASYIATTAVLHILGFLLLAAIGMAFYPSYIAALIGVYAWRSVESLSLISQAVAQRYQWNHQVSISVLAHVVLALLVIWVSSSVTDELGVAFLAAALLRYLLYCAIDRPRLASSLKHLKFFPRAGHVVREILATLRSQWALGAALAAGAVFVNLPRYVAPFQLSETQTAQLVAASYIVTATGTITTITGQMLLPKIRLLCKQMELGVLLGICTGMALVAVVLAGVMWIVPDTAYGFIMSALYGDVYRPSGGLLKSYGIGAIALSVYSLSYFLRIPLGARGTSLMLMLAGVAAYSILIPDLNEASSILSVWIAVTSGIALVSLVLLIRDILRLDQVRAATP